MGKSMVDASKSVRSYIPNDIVLCILSKLQIKSLKQFGCVHKSWATLFENPQFMKIYRINSISNHHSYYDDTSLLLQTSGADFLSLSGETYENIVKLDLPNPFAQDNPWFLTFQSGYVSGLLCLYHANKEEKVALWNPTTDELKAIPPSALESVPPYHEFVVSLQGFGYDHIRDDYKLIRTISYMPLSTWDCEQLGLLWYDVPWEDTIHDTYWEMYSLKSNSWRKLDIDNSVVCRGCIIDGVRVYLDGICHWWHFNYTGPPISREKTLVSFDLVSEVFYTTPIPLDISPLDECDTWRYLVVFNGYVSLISWFDRSTIFDILILGELGVKESWTKLFIVGPLSYVDSPIGIGKKGDIFFMKNDGEVVWFDLGSQKIEELGVKGMSYNHIFKYKENLHPIGRK